MDHDISSRVISFFLRCYFDDLKLQWRLTSERKPQIPLSPPTHPGHCEQKYLEGGWRKLGKKILSVILGFLFDNKWYGKDAIFQS